MGIQLNSVQIDYEISRLEDISAEAMAERLKLWSWGKWSADNTRHELGYGGCTLKFRAKGYDAPSLTKIAQDITDDEALAIDAAIATLLPLKRELIRSHYQSKTPLQTISKRLHLSMRQLRYIQHQALGALENILLTQ